MTARDAERYLAAYETRDPRDRPAPRPAAASYAGPGISIKLSALHPRYSRRAGRARDGRALSRACCGWPSSRCRYDIGLNIDAEEADRLELSLDLLERLCFEPALAGWNGIGFVVQAYQKRCPAVVDCLIDLARRSGRRLMVRLVKGAYWDGEIKRAQVDGQDGYPVYTRKAYTDVSYLACARKLLAAPDEIYPQFATHNAHTLAADLRAGRPGRRGRAVRVPVPARHGRAAVRAGRRARAEGKLGRPCRIYAPVGTHETLLAYLVRRLLENGANTSFVNRIADAAVPLDELVAEPGRRRSRRRPQRRRRSACRIRRFPLPRALFGSVRAQLARPRPRQRGVARRRWPQPCRACRRAWRAEPLLGVEAVGDGGAQPVRNPADRRDVVGSGRRSDADDVDGGAASAAGAAAPAGRRRRRPSAPRCSKRAADPLEARCRA